MSEDGPDVCIEMLVESPFGWFWYFSLVSTTMSEDGPDVCIEMLVRISFQMVLVF